MVGIIWSEDARRRLERYITRIARESSARTATKWATRIRKSVAMLQMFPEIGPPVEDAPYSGLREQIVGPYRVIYQYDGTNCLIVTVARAEQDISRFLDPENPQ
jgi:plasmid stabilization system protein ParE